jgi:hypothetical protein
MGGDVGEKWKNMELSVGKPEWKGIFGRPKR